VQLSVSRNLSFSTPYGRGRRLSFVFTKLASSLMTKRRRVELKNTNNKNAVSKIHDGAGLGRETREIRFVPIPNRPAID